MFPPILLNTAHYYSPIFYNIGSNHANRTAHNLDIRHLKNDVIDKTLLVACTSHNVPVRCLRGWDECTRGEGLYRLSRDMFVHEVPASEYSNLMLDEGTWRDVATALKKSQSKQDNTPPYQKGLTDYYEKEAAPERKGLQHVSHEIRKKLHDLKECPKAVNKHKSTIGNRFSAVIRKKSSKHTNSKGSNSSD